MATGDGLCNNIQRADRAKDPTTQGPGAFNNDHTKCSQPIKAKMMMPKPFGTDSDEDEYDYIPRLQDTKSGAAASVEPTYEENYGGANNSKDKQGSGKTKKQIL